MIILLEGYLCIINVLAFALYGIDKRRARTHHWRIPERRLLSIAWLGGALGALLGMGIAVQPTGSLPSVSKNFWHPARTTFR